MVRCTNGFVGKELFAVQAPEEKLQRVAELRHRIPHPTGVIGLSDTGTYSPSGVSETNISVARHLPSALQLPNR